MPYKEIKINRFDGGMAEKQGIASNQMSMLENFDLGNNPEYLKPFRAFTANGSDFSTASGVRKVVFANDDIWGLGNVSSGSTIPKIYKLDDPLSTSSVWSAPASSVATSGATQFDMFTLYKDYIYLFHSYNSGGFTGVVSRYGPMSGSIAFVENWSALGSTLSADISTTCDGVIGKDNNLYFGYLVSGGTTKTAIARITGAALVADVVVLPATKIIKQLVPYGNYLAIICSDNTEENSTLYLWDYVSSDVTETIDLGAGDAQSGELIGGNLIITVRQASVSNTGGIAIPFIRVVTYSGGAARQLFRIKPQISGAAGTGTHDISITSPAYSYRGNLYMGIYYNRENQVTPSLYNSGILRIGRKDENHPISYSIDYNIVSDDTTLGITDFLIYNENVLAIHPTTSTVSSAFISSPSTYATAVYETGIIDAGDSSIQKRFRAVATWFNPLATAGQVVLKYRVDESIVWTTISTNTTDNDMFSRSITIDSTRVAIPVFKRIQFRIESTGGAEILGLKMKYEEVPSIY